MSYGIFKQTMKDQILQIDRDERKKMKAGMDASNKFNHSPKANWGLLNHCDRKITPNKEKRAQ